MEWVERGFVAFVWLWLIVCVLGVVGVLLELLAHYVDLAADAWRQSTAARRRS